MWKVKPWHSSLLIHYCIQILLLLLQVDMIKTTVGDANHLLNSKDSRLFSFSFLKHNEDVRRLKVAACLYLFLSPRHHSVCGETSEDTNPGSLWKTNFWFSHLSKKSSTTYFSLFQLSTYLHCHYEDIWTTPGLLTVA